MKNTREAGKTVRNLDVVSWSLRTVHITSGNSRTMKFPASVSTIGARGSRTRASGSKATCTGTACSPTAATELKRCGFTLASFKTGRNTVWVSFGGRTGDDSLGSLSTEHKLGRASFLPVRIPQKVIEWLEFWAPKVV